jgi:hypothetical protein
MSVRRALFAAILVTAAGSAAANVLVVRASGPSARAYPPGRSLPDNARITLQASDTLVVLGPSGTRTFRGPGTFSPSAAVQAGQRLASNGGRLARIGAVRNAGFVPRSPTIWHVDVTQSGTICLASTGNVMLWRPEASSRESLAISGPGGRTQRIQWPAGQAVLAWPAGAQITSGAAYSFRQAGVAVPVEITFRTLRTEPTDLQAVASALIENGCQEQLDLLVESAPDQANPG